MKLLLLALCSLALCATLDPVIIVPGLSASVLQTKYKQSQVPHLICRKSLTEWTRVWINLAEFFPKAVDCFVHTMSVVYDPLNNTFAPQVGTEFQPADFGGVNGIYSLDPEPLFKTKTKVYGFLIDYLKKLGYVERQTLFGAPYDFRMSSASTQATNGQYDALKKLVEEAFRKTGRPSHLIGHSMGGPFIHEFLVTYVTQEWKDQYIGSFISLGSPFGGSNTATYVPICGMDWRVPLKAKDMGRMCQNFGCFPWMMPVPEIMGDEVLVSTPTRNYTAWDLPDLFREAGRKNTEQIMRLTQAFEKKYVLEPPRVPVHVFYSLNFTTANAIELPSFRDTCANEIRVTSFCPGDETVCESSLLGFQRWGSQSQPIVSYKIFTPHTGMVKDPEIFAAIKKIVMH